MNTPTLADLGWNSDLLRQLELDEIGTTTPARVSVVHRNRIDALAESGPVTLIPPSDGSTGDYAVGDWILARDGILLRHLDRRSLLARKAAGTGLARQLIAANLDTILIVSSCNADFNLGRLERYLVLAAQSGIEPVIVLTKADGCDDPAHFVNQAKTLQRGVGVIALDARQDTARADLAEWCRRGTTVALLGSSGVGKSTLANALTGGAQDTGGIREDDAKGRHTTTARHLLAMANGGWLIDTPGVRELQLTDVGDGIDALFDDLTSLAAACRFSDCRHQSEPGCAIQAALADGTIDETRLHRWEKLKREDRFNTQTIHQAHQRARNFGKMHRKIGDKRKGGKPF